jgi:hypothetical protein
MDRKQRATESSSRFVRAALVGMAIVASFTVVEQTVVQASPADPQSIAIFGDSLAFQASPYLVGDFSSPTSIEQDWRAGSSLCDWLPTIEKLTTSDAPTVAVLEFIGNVSSCDGNATSPKALAARYKADLEAAITKLRSVGVRDVVVDEGPRSKCTFYAYCAAEPALRTAFLQVVASFRSPEVVYATAADRSVETASGAFSWTKTCLWAEVQNGLCTKGSRIVVRNRDGVHFCPVNNVVDGKMVECRVYASGAYRFATGLAQTIWKLDGATEPTSARTTP